MPTGNNRWWWWLGAIIPLTACSYTTYTRVPIILLLLLPLIHKHFLAHVNGNGTADNLYTLVTNATCSTSLLRLAAITIALNMGPTSFPERSVRNYHYLLRNSPEQRGSLFLPTWQILRLSQTADFPYRCHGLLNSVSHRPYHPASVLPRNHARYCRCDCCYGYWSACQIFCSSFGCHRGVCW